jgi:DnaJ domain
MNEIEAREILGCSSTAGYKELKASYRRMMLVVHPDKAGKDFESQERAKVASSRVNHAWEYLEEREKSGLLGKVEAQSPTNRQTSRGRATYPHECDICGFAPAIKISAPIITTFIYFLRRSKYDLNACKSCGLALSRMALRETLIKGWWGFGIVFVPHAIYRYYLNTVALGKIDPPSFRDPEVVTVSPYPLNIPKSPIKEPAPLIASTAALIIIGAFLFGDTSTENDYTAPSVYFGEVGTCYIQVSAMPGIQVQLVDCNDSNATLRSIAIAEADYLCPSLTLFTTNAILPDGTIKTACLESI